jgi:hypothetical protein
MVLLKVKDKVSHEKYGLGIVQRFRNETALVMFLKDHIDFTNSANLKWVTLKRLALMDENWKVVENGDG